jgi:transposase
MVDYHLSEAELRELRVAHRQAADKREAYRINAVILLGRGWSAEEVSEALLIDADTARSYFKRYKEGGVKLLGHVAFRGSECWLDAAELAALDAHLSDTLYLSAKDIAHWVAEQFGVRYSESGMTALLHRLGYVYKKPKLVPGKADPAAQEAHLEDYKKLKEDKGEHDPIYFMDATHPQHNPALAYGWIKRGEERAVPSNTGRQRLNINGVIEIDTLEPIVRFDDTINAASTIALFQQVEQANPKAERILIICDNARYYRSKHVRAFLETSKIELVFLPPYAPNLNLIERFWKFFKKQVLYNQYHATFEKFKKACETFFANVHQYAPQLRALLTENFQIIGN